MFLTVAAVGAMALSAQAGVHFGFSIGFPLPVPVVVAPPVVVTAPACPPAEVVVAVPPCPGPDYVWVPGYYGYRGHDRIWIGGAWNYHPTRVVVARDGYYGHDRGFGWHDYDRHDYDRHDYDHGRNFGHDGDRDHDRGHDHDGYRH